MGKHLLLLLISLFAVSFISLGTYFFLDLAVYSILHNIRFVNDVPNRLFWYVYCLGHVSDLSFFFFFLNLIMAFLTFISRDEWSKGYFL